MPHATSVATSWHDPFDGSPRRVEMDSSAGLGNLIILKSRPPGDEILTVFPFTDSGNPGWGATADLASATVTFSVDLDCSVEISATSGSATGLVPNAAYSAAGSPHTVVVPISGGAQPTGVQATLKLELDIGTFSSILLGKYLSVTNTTYASNTPAPVSDFWRDFQRSHEVP